MSSGVSRHRAIVIGVAAVAIVAIGGASVWALSGSTASATAKPTMFPVKSGTISQTSSASGTIQSVNSRALTFGTSGTLATVSVKAGDHVTIGEQLATIDNTNAEAAVTSAQSALDAANTNLTLARQQAASPAPTATGATTCTVQPAAFVLHPTTPTPTPTPSPSASASPSPSPSTGSSHSASPTPSQGSSSGHGSGGSGGSGGSTGTSCTTNRGSTGQGQSQNQGQNQQAGGTDSLLRAEQSVNNDQLALDQAEQALNGTVITAPIDGRVLSVGGAVGASVSAGGSGFIVLGGEQSLAVVASFSEADVASVKIGQKASVTLANHAGVTYQATVTQIDPAGTTSGTLVKYGVQLSFTSVPSGLLLGQSANVAVTTASAADVLYVPTAAITTGASGVATVIVRSPSGDSPVTVTTGLSGDQGTEIKSGLTAGQVVVVPAK